MEPVFDEEQPLGSTRAMRIWYTTKVCHPTQKSQIGHMLADGAWVQAVNARGGFGIWCWDVAFEPAQIRDIFDRHGR
jgi:type III restriction enzyme